MDQVLKDGVLEYLNTIPVPEIVNDMDSTECEKYILAAYEDVLDEYPEAKNILTTRIVALQAIYTIEGEEEGFAAPARQGVTDYTVKDVKAVIKREILSPKVNGIIRRILKLDELEEKETEDGGRFGWLV